MSKLLINEQPLQVQPALAETIGLNEALILQQIHYWLSRIDNHRDGHNWVYNTYADWAEQFPFWSIPTIRRTFKNLEGRGLIVASEFNRRSGDRTKWYRIDYEALKELENDRLSPSDQNDQTICSKRSDHVIKMSGSRSDQNDQLLPETTHKTTTERGARGDDLPEQPPTDPLKIFENLLPHLRLTVLQKHEINNFVTDTTAWEKACRYWRRGDHHNVALLMEKYEELSTQEEQEWKPSLNLWEPDQTSSSAA